ncbi:MAG: isoprenylcysteine carboxylmethyltransferase family protein [Chloroflexota bacterium]
MLYSVVHSILASHTVKALSAGLFGGAGEKYYRLFFNFFGTLTLLPILAMPALLPDQALYAVSAPWANVMRAIQVLALVMLAVPVLQTGAFDFIGISQALGVAKKEEDKLVVNGLYKYVRHPIYTAGIVLLVFNPTMSQNSLALFISIIMYLIVGALFEERKLESFFGEDYTQYKKDTPFLIPWPRVRN